MKYAWIDTHRDQYSVSRLCRVLGVSCSGYSANGACVDPALVR